MRTLVNNATTSKDHSKAKIGPQKLLPPTDKFQLLQLRPKLFVVCQNRARLQENAQHAMLHIHRQKAQWPLDLLSDSAITIWTAYSVECSEIIYTLVSRNACTAVFWILILTSIWQVDCLFEFSSVILYTFSTVVHMHVCNTHVFTHIGFPGLKLIASNTTRRLLWFLIVTFTCVWHNNRHYFSLCWILFCVCILVHWLFCFTFSCFWGQ